MARLILAGLSHRTAPVEWREKLAVPAARLPALLAELRGEGFAEAVALSTCNRVELYAVAEDAEAPARARRRLAGLHGDAALARCFYEKTDAAAVEHLFRVSAGLDSLVVGEHEVLGQVKRAYEAARAAGATGKLTNVLFQRALYVGKTARSRTALAEGADSVADAAVGLAERIFGDLHGRPVLVVGAGEVAERALHAFVSQKAGPLTVVNRTWERARDLAARFGGEALPFSDLAEALARVDVALFSTGSPEFVVRPEHAARALERRGHRPLFFVDVAVPRDVDPAVHSLENAYVYNIDDLQAVADDSLRRRRAEVEKAEALVAAVAREFADWYGAWSRGESAVLRHAGTVAAVHTRLE